MNVKRIGDCAGAIWKKLRASGNGVSLASLKKTPGFSSDEALAAVGWLAREGKVEFETQGRRVVVRLVEAELCV